MSDAIFLPDEVLIRQQIEAQLEARNRMIDRHGFLKHFNEQLRALDPRLSLVKAKENADNQVLIPGYWHIMCDNEGTIPTYYPIVTPDGGFKEPESSDLDRMRAMDTRRNDWFDEACRRQDREMKARLEAERDYRVEKMADVIRFHERVSVSIPKGLVK